MNHTMFSADRMTHLKIVIVALVAATVVAGVGVTARLAGSDTSSMEASAPVLKAAKPVTAAGQNNSTVR